MAKKRPKTLKILSTHSETHARSILKAVTYRVLIIISVFIIIYWQTGKLDTAAAITGITTITGTTIYYLHERVWSRVKWGRK
jgi:uncharacterized membrane protein